MDIRTQTVLLAIVSSHLIADFCIQGDEAAIAKRQFRFWVYLKHGVTHAATAYVFAGLWSVWQISAVVLFSHPIIDCLKEVLLQQLTREDSNVKSVTRRKFWAIIFDQLLHLAILVAIVEFLSSNGDLAVGSYWSNLFGNQLWSKILVVLCGMVLSVFAGGVLISILVQPMLEEIHPAQASVTISTEQRGLENGGKLIGQLERTLILLFVLSAQPAGVGFLIAAKSILRFGELKDNDVRMEAEYVIIGTMLSFTWALVIALATQWALNTV